MQTETDFSRPHREIMLGDTVLAVSDYTLHTEVPVKRLTLCDGQPHLVFLGAAPCTLSFSTVFPAEYASELLAVLQPALHAHTPFSFLFENCTFSQMRLTAVSCQVSRNGKTGVLSVRMTGVTNA